MNDHASHPLRGAERAAEPAEAAASFEVIKGRFASGLLILCDHAGNAFPPGYDTLGMARADLERHIAYDIGAAGISRMLAARLGAPAVLSRYSRLLIDINRGADDPTLVMRLSDGAIVPGNRHLTEAELARRTALYYRPYHDAVERQIASALAAGVPPAIVSIHSFTPAWKGVPRPWQVGILWDRDDRLPAPLIAALAADPALTVGDNDPYDGALEGDCLYQHATTRGLANALVEVRQDLIGDARGQQEWADRLADALQDILDRPGMRERLARFEHHGSRTDRPGRRAAPVRADAPDPAMA